MPNTTTFGRRGLTPAPLRGGVGRPPPAAVPSPAARAVAASAPPSEAGGIEFYGAPVFTVLLTLLLALVFWVEQAGALSPPVNEAPGYLSLIALGAVSHGLVFRDGEAWRLFTAPWLHANLAHLIGNSVVLVIIGWRLERLVRSAWFLAIFMLSAVGGSLVSASLNIGGPISVGASGAIMGLLGASLTLSFHAAAQGERARLRVLALRLLIPALLPTHAGVDYSCHLGGALTGAALGLMLKLAWPDTEAKPAHAREAGLISAGTALLSAVGFLIAATAHGGYVQRQAALIPDGLLPRKGAAAVDVASAAGLAARYPRDPRGYVLLAAAELKASDPAGAEQALRSGLAQGDVLARDMPPLTAASLQAMLGAVLLQQGRMGEAQAAVAPVCQSSALSLRPLKLKLARLRLCS